MNLLGVFAQHVWKLEKQHIVINDGIRLNTSSLHSTLVDTAIQFKLPFTDLRQKNNSLTGNIGVIYTPEERVRMVANFSTGFRSPNFDDLTKVFESLSGERLIVPNTNLKPEYTRNIEASIEFKNDKTFFEMYGFYTVFNNAIVTDTFNYNGKDSVQYNGVNTRVYASVNKARAFLYGGGLNFSHRLSSSLQAYGNINYTYGRFNQGDSILIPLDHVPPVHGKAGIRYNKKQWGFDFYTLFNGKKALINYNPNGEDNLQYATPQGMPAWFTVNLKSTMQIQKQVQLQLGVENILDKNYRYFASGMSASGRNIIVAMRYNLK
jgi:hemoglobin/transferrin/lactoferrin receptor protein